MSRPHRQHPQLVDAKVLAGCTCGLQHRLPQTTLYAGDDAASILAEDCAALHARQQVLLLSDPQTDAVAGEALRGALLDKGVILETCRLDANPSATDVLAGKIQAVSRDKALIISVGSGTITDLGKFAADRNRLDFWCVPTAPSMNGYTSSIAAIKVNGVKKTLPVAPPSRLYVQPQIIRQAPLRLRQAGFCDVQAKVVSDIDWQCESLLSSKSYCGLPSALMRGVEQSYIGSPEAIGAGEEVAVAGLFRGLLTSGVAMSLAGSSAPASGGEHLVSHFWDMREGRTGRKPELHGLQVGAGIILSAACYARLVQCTAQMLSAATEQKFDACAAAIPGIWGDFAAEVSGQFNNKRALLLQFDRLLPANWPRLRELFALVPPPEYFASLFARTGAPFSLAALRLTVDEFRLAALNARAIRDRITVLDLADHAGVLEAAVEDSLQLLG